MNIPLAWLLDTNIVSEMMRPYPEPRVAGFLDAIDAEGSCIAAITVWEIFNGIGRLEPGQRREDMLKRFQGMLVDIFDERVIDWTGTDARLCAHIMEEKRRRGEPLDSHLPAAMIAATAVHHGFALVTRNEGEFRHTGAKTVNPWSESPG